MKRYIAALLMVLLPIGLVTDVADAHVLKTDGPIGAVFHIEPDDSAISGKLTTYSLVFQDTSGKFKPDNCICTVAIQENGQTISAQPLRITNALASTGTYTFPAPDAYSLLVSGKPKDHDSFQLFELTYLVRVSAGADTPTNNERPFPLLLWLGIGMLIGLVLLGAYATSKTDKIENKEK